MTGTLDRISSIHSRVRTDVIKGYVDKLPVKGERFVLFAEPVDPAADFRFVRTSEVQEVTETTPGVWDFNTEFSVYRLTLDKGN